jgi:hypothetical protein
MKKCYGIVVTDDGSFLCVSMLNHQHGWKRGKIRRWHSQALLPTYLLLNRWVNLAVPSHWVRQPEPEVIDMITVQNGNSYSACTNRSEYEHFTEILHNNLRAVYPDDALLVTLPLHFHRKPERSFLAVFKETHSVKLGIIIEGQLTTVFSSTAGNFRELSGFIERIRYYFDFVFTELSFPSALYLLNDLEFSLSTAERIECGSNDPDVLKAMGVALCTGNAPAVPQFGGPAPESKFRRIRLLLLTGMFLFLIGTIGSTAALAVYTHHFNNRVRAAKESYRNILSTNTDIRELIATGDELSRKVLRMQKRTSSVTAWGPFLYLLGSQRPKGLFIEKIGSEPVPKNISKTRLALGGWCETETIATDFIKILSKSSLLSEVTLSSMERIGKDKTTCRFKIVCLLSTIEH